MLWNGSWKPVHWSWSCLLFHPWTSDGRFLCALIALVASSGSWQTFKTLLLCPPTTCGFAVIFPLGLSFNVVINVLLLFWVCYFAKLWKFSFFCQLDLGFPYHSYWITPEIYLWRSLEIHCIPQRMDVFLEPYPVINCVKIIDRSESFSLRHWQRWLYLVESFKHSILNLLFGCFFCSWHFEAIQTEVTALVI